MPGIWYSSAFAYICRELFGELNFVVCMCVCVSVEWKMVLVDLRNHGSSARIKGLSPPHDMSSAAKDLADLVKARGWTWPDVVVGHSMGGKVALDFAESCSRGDYGESAALPKQVQ